MRNDFWKKLTAPIPLYTEGNVRDTIAYIDERQSLPFAKLFKTALTYVQSQLTGSSFEGHVADVSRIGGAYRAAAHMHDNAIHAGEFIAAVRWRYVMEALSDYRKSLISKEAVI